MHELSIAESIIRIAAAHAGERRVTKVAVKVGHLRQVVPSSLEFGFELVAADTVVEGAKLEIEEVPAVGRCTACAAESRQVGFPMRCEACGGLDLEVIEGEELTVDSLELLELDEELATTSEGRGT